MLIEMTNVQLILAGGQMVTFVRNYLLIDANLVCTELSEGCKKHTYDMFVMRYTNEANIVTWFFLSKMFLFLKWGFLSVIQSIPL